MVDEHMDLGPALKVASAPVSAPVPAVISMVGTITPETELPASKVVLPAGAAEQMPAQSEQPELRASSIDLADRRVTIDAETHELVRQSIDARTNEVLDQYPDKTMLGLRAYFERLTDNAATKSAAAASDDGGRKVVRVQA